jgi:hypothetical protein
LKNTAITVTTSQVHLIKLYRVGHAKEEASHLLNEVDRRRKITIDDGPFRD